MTARWVFWCALIVGAGAAAATAHGLYEVAVASRVPAGIAWLYPVITDGLALVAYAATRKLAGSAARYAWTVVVAAAALSGLAQAVLLATDPATATPLFIDGEQVSILAAPAEVRFGIGAWPAVAAAVVAHLLYLLAAATGRTPGTDLAGVDVPASPVTQPDEQACEEPRDWWGDAPTAELPPPTVAGTSPTAPVPVTPYIEDLARRARVDVDLVLRVEDHLAQTGGSPTRRTVSQALGLGDDHYGVRKVLEARALLEAQR